MYTIKRPSCEYQYDTLLMLLMVTISDEEIEMERSMYKVMVCERYHARKGRNVVGCPREGRRQSGRRK